MKFLVLIASLVMGGASNTPTVGGEYSDAGTVAIADTVIVKMVDVSSMEWRFEPSTFDVQQGTVVRFVQADVMPHNVEFRDPPSKAGIDDILFGPFLLSQGEVYDVLIDERFVEGTYEFVCTPHVAMGMTGTMQVIPISSTNEQTN